MRVVTYNYDSISSNFLDDLKAFHSGGQFNCAHMREHVEVVGSSFTERTPYLVVDGLVTR